MKKSNTTVFHFVAVFSMLFLTTTVTIFGQTPGTLNYQAVLRDAGGVIMVNENASIQLVIHQGTETGTQVFSEVHNATTNAFGLVNLEIGSIDQLSFSAIDWSAGPYFVEIYLNGTSMGTSQLLSVPYALYAASGNPGPQGDPGPQGPSSPLFHPPTAVSSSVRPGSRPSDSDCSRA